MVAGWPSLSISPSTRAAGTPKASEKLRIVQGSSTTMLLFRGAAVDTLPRLRRRSVVRIGRAGSSSSVPSARRTVVVRLRFNWRCSRPPKVTAPSVSSAAGAARPRRLRSLRPAAVPASPVDGGAAGPRAGPRGGPPAPAGRAGCSTLRRSISCLRFSSCFRKCSERGTVPMRDARMTSSGSLISGFCGAGSVGLLASVGCCAAGIGRQVDDGCRLLGRLGPGRGLFAFFLPCGRLFQMRRFLRLTIQGRHLAGRHSPRRQILVAPERRTRAGRSWRARSAIGGSPPAPASAAVDRRASAALEVGLHLGQLLIVQAGQRRPLAGDTQLVADLDQRLIVDLELLR